MFESIFNLEGGSLQILDVIICFCVSLILGILVACVHMKTSKYSKNFVITLAILPILVQSIMMMVNGNLGTSVAVLGAFSLIRFRSIPGNSKEIAAVFLSMAIGLACGMGQILFAIIFTLISCATLFVLTYSKFGNCAQNTKILKIIIPEDLNYTNVFDEIFQKYTKEVNLEQVKTTNMGSMFELKYKVRVKEDINEKEFIDDLRIRNGNLNITLSNPIVENEL